MDNDEKIKEYEAHKIRVPSYNEYQSLLSDQLAKNEGVEINAELEERLKKTQKLELDLRRENAKLKELLKECKERLIYCTISTHDVQAKINQVLGEE